MKRWGPVAAAVLVVGLSISATGSRAMAATSLVDARDDFFFASVVHIDVGGSVTWHNRGYATHNVVADEGLAKTWKIAAVPTLVVIKDGRELHRLVGLKDMAYLREALGA